LQTGYGTLLNTEMITLTYTPSETEKENASHAYILTLMTVLAGLPFPVINLFACIGFYFLLRKRTPFVKFHALQAILSQIPVIIMNSGAVIWTFGILFRHSPLSNTYISYIITVILFNSIDIFYNIIAAIKARNGFIYSYALFGPLAWYITTQKEQK
jgi:uncharacterized membrane protein